MLHLSRRDKLLSQLSQCKHIKIRHDQGKIAGHGHFLVLVSGIYDPAFYYTEQDLKHMNLNVDVVNIV